MEPFNGEGYGSDYSSFVVIVFSFFLSCSTGNIIVLCQNTTNVKNMHPHRDSNPGPWITVPML